jgi:glucosamine--fructose-6-phosphate aminotransferase (isomerizing)
MSAARAIRVEDTRMFQEAERASDAVRAQLQCDAAAITAIGTAVRRLAPRTVITCARGSSDHAATFAKYLIETRAGVLTASAAPSISSVYGVSQDLRGCLFIAISQSGRSPDLLASVAAAKSAGATILALCNSPDAPLVAAADLVIELRAGVETSVAATKSYLATLAALVRMVAAWTQSASLASAIEVLPTLMDRSWALDWSAGQPVLESAAHLYVVGRGLGLGAAQEAALKCKETCGLHAEAFSAAEVRHGPMAIVGPGFPVLFLTQDDDTSSGTLDLARQFSERGAHVWIAGNDEGPERLPVSATLHPACTPIVTIASFYRAANALALRRGRNPDMPPHLRKVTETV